MVAKKSRQSRPAASKSAPRTPASAASRANKAGAGATKTRATKAASSTTKPRATKAVANATKPGATKTASSAMKGRATKAASSATKKPSATKAASGTTKPRATKTASSATKRAAPTPSRTPRQPPRPPEQAPEDTTFEDVPVASVRRQRRTVATSTGRRRIKHHRPAPHANAPGSGSTPTDAAHEEDTELAPLPTQTARGIGTREGRTLPIEIDPERIEQSLRKLGGELTQLARRGRYTKVRFRFRGKPLLPDLPLAAVVAAEGLTFYWGGILRALLMNVAGGSLLDVELIHDAEKEIQAGKEALLSGELDRSISHYQRAVDMQPEGAQAHLNLGIALKLKGERDAAGAALERALALDPEGPVGAEAKRLLERL